MSSVFPEITRGWDWRTAPHAHVKLSPIWPIKNNSVCWRIADMTDDDAQSFATVFVRYSDDLALRVGYR
jgi:hypothetical protein